MQTVLVINVSLHAGMLAHKWGKAKLVSIFQFLTFRNLGSEGKLDVFLVPQMVGCAVLVFSFELLKKLFVVYATCWYNILGEILHYIHVFFVWEKGPLSWRFT